MSKRARLKSHGKKRRWVALADPTTNQQIDWGGSANCLPFSFCDLTFLRANHTLRAHNPPTSGETGTAASLCAAGSAPKEQPPPETLRQKDQVGKVISGKRATDVVASPTE